MSRKIEEKKVMKEVVKKNEKVFCDLCGIEEGTPSWGGSTCYQVDETEISITIKQKEGDSFPEGGFGEEYIVDICPTCFKKKLIPWLESQGANIKQTDWDW